MVLSPKVEITREFVFSKISAEDVYCMELPGVQIGHAICSPLRKDNSPSMVLKISQSGMRHHDFVYPEDNRYSGGPVDFVMSKYGLGYDAALHKIAQDFQLLEGNEKYKEVTNKYVKPMIDIKRSSFIQVEARKWQPRDEKYWGAFGITRQELISENVYPVETCSLNRMVIVPPNSLEIVYAYKFTEGFKIYMPLRPKREKWVCNIPTGTVEGLEKVKDARQIIITKSRKDRLVLSRYLPNVISVQNETRAAFKEELIATLQGKDILINFDSDSPGKTNSLKLTREFGYRHLNTPDTYLPTVKDFSDLFRDYGEKAIVDHLKIKGLI